MDKDECIKLRDILKAGKNLPVRVCLDNVFAMIDESKPTQFTIWDDNNGILYCYRLMDPIVESMPSNKESAVSLFAISYDSIQAIELPVLPLKNLEYTIESIKSSGRDISDDYKNLIINTYDKILSNGLVELTHDNINKLVGSNLDTNDDYYNGRYKESFKETRQHAELNKYVDKVKQKEESGD